MAHLPRDWNCRSGRPHQTWLHTVESDVSPLNIDLTYDLDLHSQASQDQHRPSCQKSRSNGSNRRAPTDKRTHTDATKRSISPATRSIIILDLFSCAIHRMQFLHATQLTTLQLLMKPRLKLLCNNVSTLQELHAIYLRMKPRHKFTVTMLQL